MAKSMRCRLTGCDRNECGVCIRCGSEKDVAHKWVDAESEDRCIQLKRCERCDAEKKKPDHDWEPTGKPDPTGIGGPELRCSRCGMVI